MNSMIVKQVHDRAVAAANKFITCQVEVIESLELADRHRVYLAFECTSLFAYATKVLGYSEDVACMFINLARKSREVPALKEQIRAGRITASKANRLISVLNQENQKHWLEAAATSSKKQLEKLVASENPRAAVVEKTTFVAKDRIELQVGVSEKFMIGLRRAQDVLSQKKRRPVSLEETLEAAVAIFNQKSDPLERAKRQMIKGKLTSQSAPDKQIVFTAQNKNHTSKSGQQNSIQHTAHSTQQSASPSGPGRIPRMPLRASIRHKLNIKFQGQCAHQTQSGERCGQRRFLDIHHVKPVSEGGTNELENLELLCSGHHRSRHH